MDENVSPGGVALPADVTANVGEFAPKGIEGPSQIKMAPDNDTGLIHMDFGQVTRHISLNPEQAKEIATAMRIEANRMIRGRAPGKRRPRNRQQRRRRATR